ncbi:MAG: pilin [Methylococcaceae bacterium]
MKKVVLLLLLLNIPAIVFAKAVEIQYKSYSLNLLKITVPIMQDGKVNYQQTITITDPNNYQQSTTHVCMEMNTQATEQQFNDLVSQLQNAGASAKAFKLKTLEHCNKNLSACFNSPKLCSGSAFVGSSAITEYITKSQFYGAMAEISPGKTLIEVNLNEGTPITSVQQLGLNDSSNYCSQITVSANNDTGEANLSCVIKGSIFVNGKTVSWIRNNQGYWNCETNLSPEDHIKYADRCN